MTSPSFVVPSVRTGSLDNTEMKDFVNVHLKWLLKIITIISNDNNDNDNGNNNNNNNNNPLFGKGAQLQ